MIRDYLGKMPKLGQDVFVAETAAVIGDVEIGERSSIWYGAVLRGDVYYIRVGKETSIQDGTVIHVTGGKFATMVGDRVTVGHSVTLHGCTVRDRVIVGMGATLLDEVEVGERSIIGAGSLVAPRTKIPPGVLALGQPAKVKRELTDEELAFFDVSAENYVKLAAAYLGKVP